MDKEPLSLRFAKNVELNRRSLIQNIRGKKGLVDDDASLDKVVEINNSIPLTAELDTYGKHEVRFFDCDGSQIGESIWVENGGSVTPPPNPNYDPERLEFVRWASAIGNTFDNIVSDIDYMAYYHIIDDKAHLFCQFDENTGLNPTIKVVSTPSDSVIKIDWGDGTTDEISTGYTKTFSHTYQESGNYEIVISQIKTKATDYFTITTTSSSPMFGSVTLAKALLKTYIPRYAEYNFAETVNNQFTVYNSANSISYSNGTFYMGHIILGLEGVYKFGISFKKPTRCIFDIGYSSNGVYHTNILEKAIIPKTAKITSISGDSQGSYSCDKLILLGKFYIEDMSGTPKRIGLSSRMSFKVFEPLVELPWVECQDVSGYGCAKHIDVDTSQVKKLWDYCITANWETLILKNELQEVQSNAFFFARNLKTLTLPNNFAVNLDLRKCWKLSKDSILNMTFNAKDLSSSSTKTITLPRSFEYMLNNTFVVYRNGLYDETTKDENDAKSLMQLLVEKNWTIAYGSY
jgi:hypothetical protein